MTTGACGRRRSGNPAAPHMAAAGGFRKSAKARFAGAVAVAALLAAGCVSETEGGAGEAGAPSPLVEQAVADLSQRTGVPADRVRLLAAQAQTWPDMSLGCPEPGMMYGQMLTDGYSLRLEADGKVHEYHTSESRVVHCGMVSEPPSASTP